MTVIYFIQAVGLQQIKIGYTGDPMEVRLATLQTGNAYPLRVLGTLPGHEGTEKTIQRKFRRFRGEWYWADVDLLQYIHDNTKEYNRIATIDFFFGKKLTRRWIRDKIEERGFINWPATIEAVATRIPFRAPLETAMDSWQLVTHGYDLLGFVQVPDKKQFYRKGYLLFEHDGTLYRSSPSTAEAPRLQDCDWRVREAIQMLWKREHDRWLSPEIRLFL